MGDFVEFDVDTGFAIDDDSAVALETKGLLVSRRTILDGIRLAAGRRVCTAFGLKQIPLSKLQKPSSPTITHSILRKGEIRSLFL